MTCFKGPCFPDRLIDNSGRHHQLSMATEENTSSPTPPLKSPTCCSVSSYISSPWPTHMPPPHQLRFPLLQFYAAIPFDLPIDLRICFQQQLTPSTCAADHNPKVHTLADECLCHQAGCMVLQQNESHQPPSQSMAALPNQVERQIRHSFTCAPA